MFTYVKQCGGLYYAKCGSQGRFGVETRKRFNIIYSETKRKQIPMIGQIAHTRLLINVNCTPL